MIITIDIETIESQQPHLRDHVRDKAEKKYLAKPDMEFDKIDDERMKALSATALNAAFGEIASIAVATDLKNPKAYVRRNDSIDDELRLINEFFDDFRKIPAGFTLVGHNVYGFDRKFIHQRAMIHGLKAPQIFTRELKPWELSGVIGDTMMMWNNYQLGNNISLDDLCTAFGLRGKGSVCGSDVGELFRSGMYKEIADYNIDDVIITRDLYLKMIEVMR